MRGWSFMAKTAACLLLGSLFAIALSFHTDETSERSWTLAGKAGKAVRNWRSLSLSSASGPRTPRRMIVTNRVDDQDLSWIPLKLGEIPVTAYHMAGNLSEHYKTCPPGEHHLWPSHCPANVALNYGNEASPYLTYIMEHYFNLPNDILFIHPHENSWHRGHKTGAAALLRSLKWGAVPFANLRHWGYTDWRCNEEGFAFCSSLGMVYTPTNPIAARDPFLNEPEVHQAFASDVSQVLANHWSLLFEPDLGAMPAQIGEPACCAEFMVSRERILQRPFRFYKHLFDMLQAQAVQSPQDSWRFGAVLEPMWHVIFGEPYIMHATSKCDMYECSAEELSDPKLVSPPVPNPFVLVSVLKRQNLTLTANDTLPVG